MLRTTVKIVDIHNKDYTFRCSWHVSSTYFLCFLIYRKSVLLKGTP